MYRKVSDFLASWEHQNQATQRVLGALTDNSLNHAVADGHRDIRRLSWHIVTSIVEMAGRTGLKITGAAEDAPPPESVAEIQDAYRMVAASLAEQVKSKWNDATLEQEDDMYGEMWRRGTTLLILQTHEVHHRGQMTVLMRQAGLAVPGVYGPAKEDWKNYGMEPPAV